MNTDYPICEAINFFLEIYICACYGFAKLTVEKCNANKKHVHFGTAGRNGERLAVTESRPSGFDYMRILLAVLVICWHTGIVCMGEIGEVHYGTFHHMLNPFFQLIVPMFFALSGFLIAGSLERSKTLISFLGLRVFRIVPALAVEVLLSALVLGPIFTTYSLAHYFSDSKFHLYFLNMVGEIHYFLPGVFEKNPYGRVNGQLWTVPYELVCYVLVTVLTVLGIFRRQKWLWAAVAVGYVVQIALSILHPHHSAASGVSGSIVTLCFVVGLLLYRCRDKIRWSFSICILSLGLSILLLCLPNGVRFIALPSAYATVWFGLLNPKRNKIVLSGDYSYGVYLYGFPIQQALVATSPVFLTWYWNMLAAVPLALVIAAFSWWFVEKPVLGKRDILKRLEQWYLRLPNVRKTGFLVLGDKTLSAVMEPL